MKDVKVGDMVGCNAYAVDGVAVGVVRPATLTCCIALTLTLGEQEITYAMGGGLALGMVKGVVEGLEVLAGEGVLGKES